MNQTALIFNAMRTLGSLTRTEASDLFPEINENSISAALSKIGDRNPHVYKDFSTSPMRYVYDESCHRVVVPLPRRDISRQQRHEQVRAEKKGADIFEFLQRTEPGVTFTYMQLAQAMGRPLGNLAPAMANVFRHHAEAARRMDDGKMVVWYEPGHVNSGYGKPPKSRQRRYSGDHYAAPVPAAPPAAMPWSDATLAIIARADAARTAAPAWAVRADAERTVTDEMIGLALRYLRGARKERGEGFTLQLDPDPSVLLRVMVETVVVTKKEIGA